MKIPLLSFYFLLCTFLQLLFQVITEPREGAQGVAPAYILPCLGRKHPIKAVVVLVKLTQRYRRTEIRAVKHLSEALGVLVGGALEQVYRSVNIRAVACACLIGSRNV